MGAGGERRGGEMRKGTTVGRSDQGGNLEVNDGILLGDPCFYTGHVLSKKYFYIIKKL